MPYRGEDHRGRVRDEGDGKLRRHAPRRDQRPQGKLGDVEVARVRGVADARAADGQRRREVVGEGQPAGLRRERRPRGGPERRVFDAVAQPAVQHPRCRDNGGIFFLFLFLVTFCHHLLPLLRNPHFLS